ncbi:MAG: hypothetical protein K0R14_1482 [Burkholderiales bacterium]|jgi:hypothetical protein|nr:hypothetical protein [Burkholderiales bacterium]
MKKLNITLFFLASTSILPVFADCPSAASIQEAYGEHIAQVSDQTWHTSKIPANGINLAAIQGAELVGAEGSGPKQIMLSREDYEEYPNIAYRISCKYTTKGGHNFYLSSPEGKKYKLVNPPWSYAENKRYYNLLNYSCTGSECTFTPHP